MCGRYAISSPAFAQVGPFRVREWFEHELAAGRWHWRFNIAPLQKAPVLIHAGEISMGMLRWGLVPPWARDPSRGPINARAETVHSQPMFRGAFRRRRCLVPATGFYEWQGRERPKQPWFITSGNGSGLYFAGLWEERLDDDGSLRTYTIITTKPNELVRPLHDRMPVILSPGEGERWIDPEMPPDEARELLRPCEASLLRAWRVSTRVNNPKREDPSLIEPIDDTP